MGEAEGENSRAGGLKPAEHAGGGSGAYPQPPKTRPKRLKCPECGGERLFRDGLRQLADGSATQRWLCRKCGYRFSEKRLKKAGGKDLKSCSALSLTRRVCAQDGGVENSAEAVKALEEEKANAESWAAGATEKPSKAEFQGKILEFLWWMKKQGYANSTIEGRVKILKRLVKLGANLYDPESVKEAIARQSWSERRKELAVEAYSSFLEMCGGRWDPPRYRRIEKLPWIPTETEIDQLIAGCGPKIGAFLQLIKETGIRPGEALRLKWIDMDSVNRTLSVTPEKGSNPRIFKVSPALMERLNALLRRFR